VQIARKVRQKIASLAILGIVGWLLAFAVHLHIPGQEHSAGPHSAHHACLLCAAFQPGAGAAASLPAPEIAKPSWTEVFVAVPAPLNRSTVVYRSRAPPAV
jgi:hypothetical protein